MAAEPQMVPFPNEVDCSPWVITPPKKGPKAYNSYVNVSKTSRDNPRFQFPCKLRVKFEPSPGMNTKIADDPHSRRNVVFGIPRSMADMIEIFNEWDKIACRHTFENQSVVWPNKRPKSLEDLIPDGLFLPSVKDSQKAIDNNWDPQFKAKAVPLGPADKRNKNPTLVFVTDTDGTVREGTVDDIEIGDDVVPLIVVEGWYGGKESGYVYRIDECMVYKGNRRSGPSMRALDGTNAPLVKRSRPDPNDTTPVAADGGGGGGAASSDGGNEETGPGDMFDGMNVNDLNLPDQDDF